MARKKKHEEHVNAEAWAIPYGDLVTLLLALFVVMYAMSSVNEGKYRILSDSMIAAFRGTPKSMAPINVGENKSGKTGDSRLSGVTPTLLMKIPGVDPAKIQDAVAGPEKVKTGAPGAGDARASAMVRMERAVQGAMQPLIDAHLVTVKHEPLWLEVQINADILFPSGSSGFAPQAAPILDKLAGVLAPFGNPIRVEGHTDNRPIKTAAFPSNWELSAARAASVVHQLTRAGVDALRLEIVGFGEFRPLKSNDTAEGRNANRRVAILIMEAAPATGEPAPSPRLASDQPSISLRAH